MVSSSSSLNWLYDVFVSFRGEDVRVTFLSHFFKELDQKLITAFKDNEIKKSHSLSPELEKAIWSSRIAVVVFSKNYASSSWCLNELLEIVTCKDKIVIPIFYGVVPSDVRKQMGDFGKIFEETCKNNTEKEKDQWKKALTDVANMLGFDSAKWDNEAKMIEEIANYVLGKLLSTSSKDFENFVGIEDHIAEMSGLLQLESEEVRMVGIWGSPGIGKTTIARALFNQLSRNFQVSKFIDRAFVSKSKELYSRANPDDHNMKLHLQENFLSEILGIKDIKINHLGALRERLQHQKVLIIIDDLDDLMVLEVLADKTQWFGSGRIIVVTNDRHFLMAHRIDHIYEVSFPTEVQAFQMLCQSAFRKNYAPEGFENLVNEVARHVGNLPLGLNVLGKYLQGQDKEYWMYMLTELQNGIDDENEKILRISYDRLDSKEKAIFRHIACLFNHMEETTIKSLLADSKLGVNIALKNLADKALIHVRHGHVVMHRLLQEMGKKIVRTQSIDKPGKREFLMDSIDICYVLSEGIGTPKVLGISLDTSEIDELHVHESAFKGMLNLRFLKIGSNNYFQKEYTLHLPESFDYFPLRLQLLCWAKYPMSRMPSNFCPKNLVKIDMQNSKLEKLWEGVVSLTNLKEMDLSGSHNLKEIPDLSMVTNLETLYFGYCSSLVELPSSIGNLNKLLKLNMNYCSSLETLPTGFNLKSLHDLNFTFCWQLKTFPEFSNNISVLDIWGTNIEEFPSNLRLKNLVDLSLSSGSKWKQREGVKNITLFMEMLSPTLSKLVFEYSPSLVEIPSSFQNLNQLKTLWIRNCRNLEILPTGINLKSLNYLNLYGCSRLRSFPEISTNISRLDLEKTGIEEVSWRIKNFSNLSDLSMTECINLKTLPKGINLKSLDRLTLSRCSRLRSFPEISTNISRLYLEETGIEEVPWRIENFSKLNRLSMERCRKLKCVSLNISKMKHLTEVNFSYCWALTRVDLSGYSSEVAMEADNIDTVPEEASSSLSDDYVSKANLDFSGCFKLDKEALLEQQSVTFKSMILPGEEVPSYFTHRTTEDSLTFIPLLHSSPSQPFFRFRVCAVVINVVGMDGVNIDVNCQFKGTYGNSFDVTFSVHYFPKEIRKDSHQLLIFDCHIPLNEDNAPFAQRNYDHVDMQIDVRNHYGSNSKPVFQGWGIRLSEDCSSPEDRLGYPNTLQHICEDNTVSDVCHETKYGEDSDKISEIDKFEECGDSDIGSEIDQFEDCGDSDIDSETDQFEECGNSDIGNEIDDREENRDIEKP